MYLKSDENIIRVFHHHPFPFFIRAVKAVVVSLPFFLVATFFWGTLDALQMSVLYFAIAAIFAIYIIYDSLIYFLDRLVVTNCRIVHIDWKNLFSREESETEFRDIQDIKTKEMGLLSSIKLFDYGLFQIETASSKASIVFHDAVDPEGIKNFIYQLHRKPGRIESPLTSSSDYDREPGKQHEEANVTSAKR